MKVLKKYEILNSEGPIMLLKKHKDHWSLTFHGTRIHTVVDPAEMISFLTACSLISTEKKTYRYDDYSEGEKMRTEDLANLLKDLLEDHNDRCDSDEEYFNKYCKR